MAFSPLDVKKLRDKTGAGFGDCKEALEKSGGDPAAAEKYLKEKGLASVAKRQGRVATEGRIFAYSGKTNAGIMEISCETDFVARNSDFISTNEGLLKAMVEAGISAPRTQDEDVIKELAAKIKENLSIRNFKIIPVSSNELVQAYVHGDGNIGVLAKVRVSDAAKVSDPLVRDFVNGCALHAAAFNPTYLSTDKIEDSYKKEQEEIFKGQAANLDKPEKVIAGIIAGKLKKHLSEITFLDQGYVKDDKLTVAEAGNAIGKTLACKVELVDYIYLHKGL